MPGVNITNSLLANRASALRALLNADSFLLLYVNNVAASPDRVLGDLVLATFPGYSAVNLVGLWLSPIKVDSGVYVTVAPTQTFVCSGASAEMVFGAGIYSSLGLLALMPFQTPIPLHAGLAIPVQFSLVEAALLNL